MEFASIPEVLEELRQGRFVVVVDDPKRENEGDLICAAEKVTPEHVNFMLKHARGEVCTTLDSAWVTRLGFEMQADENTSPLTDVSRTSKSWLFMEDEAESLPRRTCCS